MAGVEDDRVVRRVEYPVQRQRQFDDAEVGSEVASSSGDFVNQKLADLDGKIAQIRREDEEKAKAAGRVVGEAQPKEADPRPQTDAEDMPEEPA